MLVTCSGCQGRFRIADERIPPQGVRARCSRCSTILFVRRGEEARALESAAAPPPPPREEAPPPLPDAEVEAPEPERTRPPDPWGGVYESRSSRPPPMPEPDWDVTEEGPAQADPAPPPLGFGEIPPSPGPGGDLEFDPANPPPPPASGDWEAGAPSPDPFEPPPLPPPPPPEHSRFGDGPGSREDPFVALSSGGSATFGAFDPEAIGGDAQQEEPIGAPSPAEGAPAPAPPEPRPPMQAGEIPEEEPKAPFPQRSTIRRPPSRESAQRPWMRTSLGKVSGESRLSVFFWGMILTVMVSYGALVGLGQDPLGVWAWVGTGQVGEAVQLRRGDIVAGFYPQDGGGRLLYVRGTVRRQPEAGGGAIRVEARLLDDEGATVAQSAGWAGVSPGAEELAAVRTEADWTHLSRALAERIPSQSGEELPFVLAFPGVDPGALRLQVEVVARTLPTAPPREQRDEVESQAEEEQGPALSEG